MDELADKCNPNLISDVGVAAVLLDGAIRGAKLNVEINLSFLKDEKLKAETGERLAELMAQAAARCESAMAKVKAKMG